MRRLQELDDHVRAHGMEVYAATPQEISYINPHTGSVSVVSRRAELADEYADSVCFVLGIPKLSEVASKARTRSPRE